MKQGFVKVASATPGIRVADPVYNARAICTQAKEAAEHGAKIIVFPELCVTGYTCNDLFLQNAYPDEAWQIPALKKFSLKDQLMFLMIFYFGLDQQPI